MVQLYDICLMYILLVVLAAIEQILFFMSDVAYLQFRIHVRHTDFIGSQLRDRLEIKINDGCWFVKAQFCFIPPYWIHFFFICPHHRSNIFYKAPHNVCILDIRY